MIYRFFFFLCVSNPKLMFWFSIWSNPTDYTSRSLIRIFWKWLYSTDKLWQWCSVHRMKAGLDCGGTKTQCRAEHCLEWSWLVEWEYGLEPALDRTAKERHIRLHCMHMPGEMETDRHSAAQEHLPEPGTIQCICSIYSWPAAQIMQDFYIDSAL